MPLLLIAALLFSGPAVQRPQDIVKWSAATPAKPVRPGSVARIALKATIEEGWKLYALTQLKGGPVPLEIAVPKDAPFTLAAKEIVAPVPKVEKDETFSVDTRYYEREVAFTLPVLMPQSASGTASVPIDVTFQACGASICLRPFTQRIVVPVAVSR